MITNCECVDRDIETQSILKDITDKKTTFIKFVYSTTSTGKTFFTNKVIHSVKDMDIRPICIRTSPVNSEKSYIEWGVFRELVECTNKIANESQNEIMTYDKYCSVNDKVSQSIFLENISNVISTNTLRGKIFNLVVNCLKSRKTYIDKQIPNNLADIQLKKEYLKFVFSTNRILLIIDNIQNIDSSSLKAILDVIADTNDQNHYALLEYTIADELSQENLDRIMNFVRGYGLRTDKIPLKNLPSEYILDVVNYSVENIPDSFSFCKDILQYYEQRHDGNLMQLISHAKNYNENDSEFSSFVQDDEILKRILNLSECEWYVLSVIIYNNGTLKESILKKILPSNFVKTNLEQALVNLDEFIFKKDDSYLIRHATTIDSWRNSNNKQLAEIDIIIQNQYLKHYQPFLQGINVTDEAVTEAPWRALLKIYKEKYPDKIYTIILFLKKGIFKKISIETIWICLDAFIESTCDKIHEFEMAYYDVIQLCFECELYSEGYTCIQKMENYYQYILPPRFIFYKMMYLSALDQHETNIEVFKKYKDHFSIGSREFLNLLLIVQASYTSINKKNVCLEIYNHIKSCDLYKSYEEYGYFLRITDMYLNRKKAKQCIKQSYRFFYKRGNFRQAGKSAISCAHIYSTLGNTKKGLWYINKAEELLMGEQIGQHMIWLNKAVISMHSANFNYDIYHCLEMAEMSARVPFDCLAIQIGKLVWNIVNNKFFECSIIITNILRLVDMEPDKFIVGLAYYDLYLYYYKQNLYEEAEFYKMKALEYKDWCPTIRARFLNEHKDNYSFVLQKEWSLCYLEYWTYDILY